MDYVSADQVNRKLPVNVDRQAKANVRWEEWATRSWWFLDILNGTIGEIYPLEANFKACPFRSIIYIVHLFIIR